MRVVEAFFETFGVNGNCNSKTSILHKHHICGVEHRNKTVAKGCREIASTCCTAGDTFNSTLCSVVINMISKPDRNADAKCATRFERHLMTLVYSCRKIL